MLFPKTNGAFAGKIITIFIPTINLFVLKSAAILFCLLFVCVRLLAQVDSIPSSQALAEYQKIYDEMNRAFPEDDYRTYRRNYFTDSELQMYLTQLFKLQDLLPKIHEQHTLKLDYYLHSGNWFFKIGFPRQSIDAYKAFFAYYKKHKKDLPRQVKTDYIDMINYAYSLLAENYSKLNYPDSAKQALIENIKFTEALPGINYPSSLNNYGLFFYWTKKDRVQAMEYFKKAYQITLDSFPSHPLVGSIRDNIADIYTDNGIFSEALPLYKRNFEFYQYVLQERTESLDYPRLISAGSQLVTTYVELDSLEKAHVIMDSLQNYLSTHLVQYSAESEIEIKKAQEKLYFKENKTKEAYTTTKEILALSDSIHKAYSHADIKWRNQLNNIILDRIELNAKLERIQQENKIKNQNLKLWITTLTSSIVVILLLSLFLRRRQHLLNAKNKQLLAEQKLENSRLKVSRLNSEILSKERDLSDFAINLSQNQEWAQVLATKIEEILAANPKERELLLKELNQKIKSKVEFDKNTKSFFEHLDRLSDSFYSKLSQEFPSLSKNEIRLCSLIRLKIESRNIATLQNITLSSVNTSRYRLRKKLGLDENTDLDTFIQSL